VSFLTIELRTDRGEVLERIFDEGAIARLRPPLDDESSPCLRFVDPFGDTIFNSLQAEALSRELSSKIAGTGQDDRERILRLIELADQCASRAHVYLWLMGD
jgi:hypothetical protein